MRKVLFTATVDSHILHFHLPYLKWFKEKGYEVHVATNGDEKIPFCDVKHKVCFEKSPYRINNLIAIKILKKIIDEEQFEIIHANTPMGSVVTRLAAKEARKNGAKVIYTAHGFHFYKGAPIINWLLFYPVERYLSRYTDTLITINKEDYELANKKFKSNKIAFVNGVGVELDKFNFSLTNIEKNILRKELGCDKDSIILIFPAELSKRKNQIMLINAMKKIVSSGKNNIHLILPGKDLLNCKYQKITKKLQLEYNIHFLGYRKDISKLLKISDIAVSSSKQEGLPINIVEAMVVGLPVIATDCRGNRDLVQEYTNGYLVKINNINDMKEKVEDIINNKTKIKKLNEEILYKYSVQNCISEVVKLYEIGE